MHSLSFKTPKIYNLVLFVKLAKIPRSGERVFFMSRSIERAPVAHWPIPAMGQSPFYKHFTQRPSMPCHCPERSTKAIRIARASSEREPSPIQQFQQSVTGGLAKRPLVAAAWREDFRGVDVRNPDLVAPEPERISIDNAIDADRPVAEDEPGF